LIYCSASAETIPKNKEHEIHHGRCQWEFINDWSFAMGKYHLT